MALPEEADIPSRFPFGDSCALTGPCPVERRSVRLPADLAARLGDTADELLLAATLVLARKYSDSLAFRIGVRHASWPTGRPAVPLVAAMPSARSAAEHLRAVTDELAAIGAVADGSVPADGSAVDGSVPADGSAANGSAANGSVPPDGGVPAAGSAAAGGVVADGSAAADGGTVDGGVVADGSAADGSVPADGSVADGSAADGSAANGGVADGSVPADGGAVAEPGVLLAGVPDASGGPKVLYVLGSAGHRAAARVNGADLVVSRAGGPDGTTLYADCHAHVHDTGFTERMLGHLIVLLRQFLDLPDTRIGDLRLLTDAEHAQLRAFNDTAGPYPRDASIYELFAAQAAERPDRIAVEHASRSLTYRQLQDEAEQLAAVLHSRGIGPRDRVALLLDATPLLLVAVLAVLRLGGVYVPLDRSLPVGRRDFLLADSGAALLLVDGQQVAADVPVLDLSRAQDAAAQDAPAQDTAAQDAPAGPPDVAVSPLDPAYVLYTSGTTGRPKGVLVGQRAVIRLVRGADYVDLSPGTRILQTGALAFDATTFEFWGSLLNGGTLVLEPATTVLSSTDLGAVMSRCRINTLWLTATLFNQLVEQDPKVLAGAQVLLGGEPVSARHLALAMDACPDSVFTNGYGPTENTTFSVTHRVTARPCGRVPIGRPVANSTAWVLDRDGNPQPLGVPGELHVGGDGLSDGYLNLPELNASCFLDGTPATPERLYRTGDLARWTAEGLLDCLGRTDDQVKIRGYRVELTEIESRLSQLPGVRDAVVLLRPRAAEEPLLCAYFTAKAPVEAAQLREALARDLPDYMVPSAFLRLDEMPRNLNHKIDRAALAALEPEDSTAGRASGRAPATALEVTVAGLFAEALGLREVGVDDSFFDLGGHSLRMMRLWNRIRSVTGRDLALKQVLERPTVAGVVAALEHGSAAAPARPRLTRRS
ncbi:amino acid adenylation domain-containing protein [Streptomyces sp. NPDC048442]|uniref:amino acid adenylation domain-containing protein n=1 Tax=Streptomyces sp. NPDC048442 TaxID=3154823 RepID=UPI00343C7866